MDGVLDRHCDLLCCRLKKADSGDEGKGNVGRFGDEVEIYGDLYRQKCAKQR